MLQGEFFQNPGSSASGFYDYQIPFSCRFDGATSESLSYAVSAGAGNGGTISWWFKRGSSFGVNGSSTGSGNTIFRNSAGWSIIDFNADDELGTVTHSDIETQAKFRDPTAWTHAVMNVQAKDTVYVWINGVAQTLDISSAGNFHWILQAGNLHIGGDGNYTYDGYLAEVHILDRLNKDQDDFGEFKNGVWIPKDYHTNSGGGTGAYGTYGAYFKFANSGSLGTDSSGVGQSVTVAGLTADNQVLDSPTFGGD